MKFLLVRLAETKFAYVNLDMIEVMMEDNNGKVILRFRSGELPLTTIDTLEEIETRMNRDKSISFLS